MTNLMTKNYPKVFLYLLGTLFLLNLVQSTSTQLIFDEAYYWYYAQNLDWGYFDHPPMVALLIWMGSQLFDGELGVRLMSCFLQIGTILLLWRLVEHPKKKAFVPHFFVLLFAMPLFNVYGFFTLPDTALLFFTSLFLFVYNSFLKQKGLFKALLMGVVMAALMYSKYHAVLVILFVLLSNISLLKNKYAWIAVGVALVCYAPHLRWLYAHDFITIKYHISERPNQPYTFTGFTLGYLLNLVVNFGLLFPWFYWALFKSPAKDLFTRALLFLSYGIIAFFFLSSFQKRTQTQWVIVLCIPMAILAYQFVLNNAQWRKWLLRVGIFSALLFLYARAWLVHQPLLPLKYETHGNREQVEQLSTFLENKPPVFQNSYREASMYRFYSGKNAFSLNDAFYRRNQYSIDSSEFSVKYKKVGYTTKYAKSGVFQYLDRVGDTIYTNYITNFRPFRKLRCFVDQKEVSVGENKELLKIYNPYLKSIPLEDIAIKVSYLNAYKQIKELKNLDYVPFDTEAKFLKPRDTTYFKFSLKHPKFKDPAFIRFSISEYGLSPAINSESIKIKQ